MKPESINILGITYKVEYVDKPSDVDIFKRESLWGQIDYWTRTIRIYDNGRSIEDVWQSIFHEILHGISEALKLQSLSKEEYHDELDILALAIIDVLVRNGWFTPTTPPNNKRLQPTRPAPQAKLTI